ncbi:MAG: hypothetical protein HY979_02640 [Candidatus Magasanikbacteria bacterium]|nr:hypothetical protein [Candidatus Magasanikbacteria bacterium]
MFKKINLFLLVGVSIFSILFIPQFVLAKTISQSAKKAVIVKKVIASKKAVKKPTKQTKKTTTKKSYSKDIPMSQLPNPKSASSPEMVQYLQTINDARLIFKKEQAKAKTKEDKQAAEDKYSQAVQDAMNLLGSTSGPKDNTTSTATTTN